MNMMSRKVANPSSYKHHKNNKRSSYAKSSKESEEEDRIYNDDDDDKNGVGDEENIKLKEEGQQEEDVEDPWRGHEGPLAFQCRLCRTIVGDSFTFVCSHKELHSISLRCTAASLSISSPPPQSKSHNFKRIKSSCEHDVPLTLHCVLFYLSRFQRGV